VFYISDRYTSCIKVS